MSGEEEQVTQEGESAGAGQGPRPRVDGRSPEELTQKWADNYEEERLGVVGQIARGELEGIVEQLMDDDEEKRYDVARHIATGGRAVIPRAIELAEDTRPRMREMASYTLGQVGYPDPDSTGWLIRYPDGIPTLVRHLECDPDPEVRADAAYALAFHRDPSTARALCRAAAHPSSEVRLGVAHALGSLYEDVWEDAEARGLQEEVIFALLRLMDDADEDVRDWATFGIHEEGEELPVLVAAVVEELQEAARLLAERRETPSGEKCGDGSG